MTVKKDWIVFDEENGEILDGHPSLAHAEKQAIGYAEEYPGNEYTVYEGVSYFTTGKAVKHTFPSAKK